MNNNNIINNINVNLIVAFCKNNGIGNENNIPWKISSDLKKFKKYTSPKQNMQSSAIIMGKNTYNSIKKPLVNRDNLILSSTLNIDETFDNKNIVKSFSKVERIEDFIKLKNYDEVWIIGGSKIYDLFLNSYHNDGLLKPTNLYITYIDEDFECDTFFPTIDTNIYKFVSQETHDTNGKEYDYTILDRVYTRI
jgi:dihydrofolate reductase